MKYISSEELERVGVLRRLGAGVFSLEDVEKHATLGEICRILAHADSTALVAFAYWCAGRDTAGYSIGYAHDCSEWADRGNREEAATAAAFAVSETYPIRGGSFSAEREAQRQYLKELLLEAPPLSEPVYVRVVDFDAEGTANAVADTVTDFPPEDGYTVTATKRSVKGRVGTAEVTVIEVFKECQP